MFLDVQVRDYLQAVDSVDERLEVTAVAGHEDAPRLRSVDANVSIVTAAQVGVSYRADGEPLAHEELEDAPGNILVEQEP